MHGQSPHILEAAPQAVPQVPSGPASAAAPEERAGTFRSTTHGSNLRSVPPTRTRSPAASLRARLSRTPLTNVPLVDPTSSIQTPSRRGSTRAWFAEAEASPSGGAAVGGGEG